MKTGRPSTYIPHPTTVSRDTKTLFAKTRRRLAKKFQVSSNYGDKHLTHTYQSLGCRFHLALDAWTSPNHKAFVAYTVHWEEDGERMSTVLDFRELAEVRTLSHQCLSSLISGSHTPVKPSLSSLRQSSRSSVLMER